MSLRVVRSGLAPRKAITIPCPFLHLAFHANGGSNGTVSYERRLPDETSIATGTYTLENGAAGDWANGGYITPQGTSSILQLSATTHDKLLQVISGNYQIITLARVVKTNEVDAEEMIWQWGADARTAPGGLEFQFQSDADLRVQFFPSDNTSPATLAERAAAGEDQSISLMGVWDLAQDEVFAAVNGDFGNADEGNNANAMSQAIAAGLNPISTAGNYGFSVCSGHSPSVARLFLNGEGNGVTQLSDLWILRTLGDDSGALSALFAEYHDSPREPRLLTFRDLSTG